MQQLPLVDEWNPNPEDVFFTNAKNIIMAPIGRYYHIDETNQENTDQPHQSRIDFFMINPKKSYNSDLLRDHTCHYLNYFEKFFDIEKEYFTNLAQLKFFIDYYPEYNISNFMYDICRYIIQPSLFAKIGAMVEANYSLTLSYKSANNPQLQYTNEHAKALMQISSMMNLCIPIITHFA